MNTWDSTPLGDAMAKANELIEDLVWDAVKDVLNVVMEAEAGKPGDHKPVWSAAHRHACGKYRPTR